MQTYNTDRRFETLNEAYMGPDGVQFAGWAGTTLDEQGASEAFVTILCAWLSGTAHLVGGDKELRRLVIEYRDWIAGKEQLTPTAVGAFIVGLLLGGRGAKLGVAMSILSGTVPYMIRDMNGDNGRLPIPPREIVEAYADGAGTELSQVVHLAATPIPPSNNEIASLLAGLFGAAARARRNDKDKQAERSGTTPGGFHAPTAHDRDGRPMFAAGEVKIKDVAPATVESALIAGGFTKDTDGFWSPPGRDRDGPRPDNEKPSPDKESEWVERPGGGPSPDAHSQDGAKSFSTGPAKAGMPGVSRTAEPYIG